MESIPNLRMDVNEQTTESAGWFVHSTFNTSTFNFTTECSNGTHTFLSVPVTIYVMNVTGEFHLTLFVSMGNSRMGYRYTGVSIDAQIDNGNTFPPLLPSMLNNLLQTPIFSCRLQW